MSKTQKNKGPRQLRAEAKVKQHPLFQHLEESFQTLPPVERASLVYELCNQGNNSERAVAGALGVNPRTINRDCQLAKSSAADKNEIGNGKSITAVLKAARKHAQETEIQQKLATELSIQEEARKIKDAIIGWFNRENFWASHAEQILTSALEVLDSAAFQGHVRELQRSRLTPSQLIASTKPKLLQPDLHEVSQWFYYYRDWLLAWVPPLMPNLEILGIAMRGARGYFVQQPRHQGPYDIALSVRRHLDETWDMLARGPEAIKHPDSKWRPGRHPSYEEQQQQADAELAARCHARAERLRQLMCGPKRSSGPEPAGNQEPLATTSPESHSEPEPLPVENIAQTETCPDAPPGTSRTDIHTD